MTLLYFGGSLIYVLIGRTVVDRRGLWNGALGVGRSTLSDLLNLQRIDAGTQYNVTNPTGNARESEVPTSGIDRRKNVGSALCGLYWLLSIVNMNLVS